MVGSIIALITIVLTVSLCFVAYKKDEDKKENERELQEQLYRQAEENKLRASLNTRK